MDVRLKKEDFEREKRDEQSIDSAFLQDKGIVNPPPPYSVSLFVTLFETRRGRTGSGRIK